MRNMQLKYLRILLQESDLSYYQSTKTDPITTDKILNQSFILQKSELRYNYNKIYKPSLKEFTHSTSGSSGMPLKIISSNTSEANRTAHRYRFYDWWGIKPWDKNILLWGKMSVVESEEQSLKKRIKNLVKRPNELFISVFDLNEHSIYNLYNQCLKHNAIFIRGYTSGVYLFCYLIQKMGLNGKNLKLKVAITTSEILFEDRRLLIEEVLGCKVANEYGAAEIGLFACECPKGKLHINEELNFLQTTKDGNLLVTDLHNSTTPLLNYEIGDKISISNKLCSCGRGLRVIDTIIGRDGDLVRKPNGEFTSQYIFYYASKDISAMGFEDTIAEYKVIQRNNHFIIFIVKGEHFNQEAISVFVDRMKQNIGSEISIDIQYVNEIPKEKSGKIRFFERIDN
jgi:phenylacetate-CoA ligase